jgi:hypothetical protein
MPVVQLGFAALGLPKAQPRPLPTPGSRHDLPGARLTLPTCDTCDVVSGRVRQASVHVAR